MANYYGAGSSSREGKDMALTPCCINCNFCHPGIRWGNTIYGEHDAFQCANGMLVINVDGQHDGDDICSLFQWAKHEGVDDTFARNRKHFDPKPEDLQARTDELTLRIVRAKLTSTMTKHFETPHWYTP